MHIAVRQEHRYCGMRRGMVQIFQVNPKMGRISRCKFLRATLLRIYEDSGRYATNCFWFGFSYCRDHSIGCAFSAGSVDNICGASRAYCDDLAFGCSWFRTIDCGESVESQSGNRRIPITLYASFRQARELSCTGRTARGAMEFFVRRSPDVVHHRESRFCRIFGREVRLL